MTRLAVGLSLDPVVQPEFGLDAVHEHKRMGRHRSFISNLLSKVKAHSFASFNQDQDQKPYNCLHCVDVHSCIGIP